MSETTPVAVPRENVNDETVTLVSWYAGSGQYVEQGQPIAQIETSKTTIEIEAPAAGTLHHLAAEGEEVAIGAVICHIVPAGSTTETPPADQTRNGDGPLLPQAAEAKEPIPCFEKGPRASESLRAPEPPPRSTRFSRKAKELVQQLGLDPAQFEGRGLVRSGDILRALENAQPLEETGPEKSLGADPADLRDPASVAAVGVPFHSERLPRAKRVEADFIRSAHETTLTSAVTVCCRTLGLRAAARTHASIGESAAALIVFEAARLLRKYPAFNGFYSDGNIHYYDEVNVGFAVDAGRGLKVPVIRHADRKSIAEIAEEMRELLVAYLGDQLPVAALAGGTFTVTDLSSEDVFAFHPLINKGQSAILGVGGEVFMPGAREGVFNLVLSFDHQLSEGRAAAQFLNDLRQRLGHYEASLRESLGQSPGADEPCCMRCRMTPGELEPYGHYLVQTIRSGGVLRLLCTRCLRGY